MNTIDFEQARIAHLALKQFFATHHKGQLDRDLLADVQALCRAAAHAVPDLECRRALRSIEIYAELLTVQGPASRGVDYVRLRVQNALASFRSQLKAIRSRESAALL